MRRGMRVTTHNRHPRQGQTLLWTNDMHNTLASILHIKEGQPKIAGILLHRRDREGTFLIDHIQHAPPRHGGDIMVKHGNGGIRAAHRNTGEAQARKRLRRGGLVHQVAIDIEHSRFAWHLTYDVSIPDFFKYGFWQCTFFVHFTCPSKGL